MQAIYYSNKVQKVATEMENIQPGCRFLISLGKIISYKLNYIREQLKRGEFTSF